MKKVPVYLITGFFESGKTSFINEMAADDAFTSGEKIAVVSCEEGFEEYKEDAVTNGSLRVYECEDKTDFTYDLLKKIQKEYDPDKVFVEYNGTWLLEDIAGVNLPNGWLMGEVITLINFETFRNFFNNMRQFITDAVSKTDLIIVNRCDKEKVEEKRSVRQNLRSVNQTCDIIFENTDGTADDGKTEDDLPYDMKADVIEISEDNFGAWYVDASDSPERYENRKMSVAGMMFYTDNAGGFAFGRRAMVCCANDIRAIGFDCDRTPDIPQEMRWLKADFTGHVAYDEESGRNMLVLRLDSYSYAIPPKDDIVYFTN